MSLISLVSDTHYQSILPPARILGLIDSVILEECLARALVLLILNRYPGSRGADWVVKGGIQVTLVYIPPTSPPNLAHPLPLNFFEDSQS